MTRVLGATHPETLSVRGNLASLIKQQGDVDAAVRAQRELLDLYRTSFGPTFPETMRASINLAESLTTAGQLSEAEALLRERGRRVTGARRDSRDHAACRGQLRRGRCNDKTGWTRPGSCRRRCFANICRSTAKNILLRQIACENLAITMQRQQDWASARALFSALVRSRIETYGETHFETLSPMTRLARVYLEQKDYAAARTLFEHVVNARVATLGEAHPDTRAALYNLGSTLRDLDQLSAAAATFQRVYHADSAALGPEHDDTLRSLEQWAMSVFEAADYARSTTLWAISRPFVSACPEHPTSVR